MNTVLENSIPSEAPNDSVPIGAVSIPGEISSRPSEPRVRIHLGQIRAKIGYFPTPKQREALHLVNQPDCQFLTIPGGKRCGKTMFCSDLSLAWLHLPMEKIWVTAPSYDLAHRIWDYLELWSNRFFPYLKTTTKNNQPMVTNVDTGSWLKLKTTDTKTNLKGEGLTKLINDEDADNEDDVWYQYLQPNVRQRYKNPAGEWKYPVTVSIGNPQGKNSFYERYGRGMRGEPGYYAMHYPTAIEDELGLVIASTNPEVITVEELRRIKAETPFHIWKSDYLAQFREDEGNIFKNLFRIQGGESWKRWKSHHRYVIGWDPAKHRDFNVLTVIDYHTHEVVDFSRSNKLDYVFQKERLISFVRQYGGKSCEVVIDSTGLGEPLFDELARAGISVYDYQFTQKSKKDLIEKLALFIDHVRLRIPKIPDLQPLWDELEAFGALDKNGKLKYEAPTGKHDDCVFSLALAVWKLESQVLDDSPIKEELRKLQLQKRTNQKFNYR